ncbi:hypothetical protein AVEN_251774-1 [Araneus ventricosus]|uniref:Uncharacterized protein n=1 Tax=Araneus ventricosus TaxID=182803 RepID=A0A4Y2MUV1_ARAVE|nr:hypothetical protein AVEN_251774-1 [Araneus ventricosus]
MTGTTPELALGSPTSHHISRWHPFGLTPFLGRLGQCGSYPIQPHGWECSVEWDTGGDEWDNGGDEWDNGGDEWDTGDDEWDTILK